MLKIISIDRTLRKIDKLVTNINAYDFQSNINFYDVKINSNDADGYHLGRLSYFTF